MRRPRVNFVRPALVAAVCMAASSIGTLEALEILELRQVGASVWAVGALDEGWEIEDHAGRFELYDRRKRG